MNSESRSKSSVMGPFCTIFWRKESLPLILHWPIFLALLSKSSLPELRSLGESVSDSVNAGRNLITARCDHEKRKTAAQCITEVIGEKNSEKFFVATQDAELRKKFQEIPGVPIVYAL
ncbi:rRNA-processing protein utp23-like isoform X3 [Primulina tabacum]|uniref:rRNA-processing protein utp23-like isoform X3 n=1 Tax=Primulina tabacum TaxID=48773 RepID=UPI003F59DD27